MRSLTSIQENRQRATNSQMNATNGATAGDAKKSSAQQ